MALCVGGILFSAGKEAIFAGDPEAQPEPFSPRPLLMAGAIGSVIVLCWLAHLFRNGRAAMGTFRLLRPKWFFGLAFLVVPFFIIVPNEMKSHGLPGVAAILVEVAALALLLFFALFQLWHRDVTSRHVTALVIGFLMPFVLLTPVHEFTRVFGQGKDRSGMLIVGVTALCLLLLWRRWVLKREGEC
jgi:hypothetical protein